MPPQTTKIDSLIKEFQDFRKQYEVDMRGENKVNGEIGLINEIRDLKEYKEKYPSILWLFAHKPVQTLAVGLGVWLFIWSLTIVGLIKVAAAMLGIEVPII